MSNILELDPFAFAAAMEELGLPEEEQARLERDRRFREAEKLRAEEKERLWYEKLKAKYEPVKD